MKSHDFIAYVIFIDVCTYILWALWMVTNIRMMGDGFHFIC